MNMDEVHYLLHHHLFLFNCTNYIKKTGDRTVSLVFTMVSLNLSCLFIIFGAQMKYIGHDLTEALK